MACLWRDFLRAYRCSVAVSHILLMIMLDEFNRLGKMPIVLDSIETLRSYRANLAIVTQTIPALDEIYGENARRALQGNAGIKLYLTPSDEKTIEELSKAVGKTTKRVVTRSRSVGSNPFAGRSMSERTEETALLPEDKARRMDLDDIVLVVDAQMPVRAKRIKYYEDRFLSRYSISRPAICRIRPPGTKCAGCKGRSRRWRRRLGRLRCREQFQMGARTVAGSGAKRSTVWPTKNGVLCQAKRQVWMSIRQEQIEWRDS